MEGLALALANRSAALLRLGRFSEALEDVALAMEMGHPNPQRLKERRAICMKALMEDERETSDVQVAEEEAEERIKTKLLHHCHTSMPALRYKRTFSGCLKFDSIQAFLAPMY